MPNWVYSTIAVLGKLTDTQKEILEKINNEGLCKHYLPMPEELNITAGGNVNTLRKILGSEDGVMPEGSTEYTPEDIEEARQSFRNERLYGAKDWYYWCIEHYGTKWGDCNLDVRDSDPVLITFETAWNPLRQEIIKKFAKDFPNFSYEWEEEQGFGELYECTDGDLTMIEDWDSPYMEEIPLGEDYVYKLVSEHRGNPIGYYDSWTPDRGGWLGETLEEASEKLKTY